MNSTEMVRGLRLVAKKYENVKVGTGETNISKMCTDVADKIEELEKSIKELKSPWDVEEAPKKVGLQIDDHGDHTENWTVCPFCGDLSAADYVTQKEEICFCKHCGKKIKTLTFPEKMRFIDDYRKERREKT